MKITKRARNGAGHCSVVQYFSSIHKALGSMFNTEGEKKISRHHQLMTSRGTALKISRNKLRKSKA